MITIDEYLQNALIHIINPEIMSESFWKGKLDINMEFAIYIIYIIFVSPKLHEAIDLMQKQYNISHLEQSSIYRCIKEILDLIDEESTEDDRKGIVKVGFADWWGQTKSERIDISTCIKKK